MQCRSSGYTHTHLFNGPLSGTTRVSQCQKGKTNLDFTEARDSEWQWHQPGHMQVCTSLQTNNHASTPPLRFLQAGCPSCRPTNSVKALKGYQVDTSAANRKKFSYHTEKCQRSMPELENYASLLSDASGVDLPVVECSDASQTQRKPNQWLTVKRYKQQNCC